MKTILIIILIIMAIVVAIQVYGQANSKKTEQQAYNLLFKDGYFEIRYYPPATYASVDVRGSYKESSGSGFRLLANYIFGGNREKQKIAMTAPVRMENQGSGYTMSFVMPSSWPKDSLPEPNNPEIDIEISEARYTASITFDGWASDAKIDYYSKELFDILNRKGLIYDPRFEYLGYNPPFQLVNRRNEIMVEILEVPGPIASER
jgi:hypothetical protein